MGKPKAKPFAKAKARAKAKAKAKASKLEAFEAAVDSCLPPVSDGPPGLVEEDSEGVGRRPFLGWQG